MKILEGEEKGTFLNKLTMTLTWPKYSKMSKKVCTQNFLTVTHTQQENFEYKNLGENSRIFLLYTTYSKNILKLLHILFLL